MQPFRLVHCLHQTNVLQIFFVDLADLLYMCEKGQLTKAA